MSNPLSPLTTSRQNSRATSSNYEDVSSKRGSIDRLLAAKSETENPLLSPKKVLDDERLNSPRQSFGYGDAAYGTHEQDYDVEDSISIQDLQSSPFRPDGRDDTVDMQMMRKYQESLMPSEPTATPRKRSYDQVPEEHETESPECERLRKSVDRREAPEINVYVDEASRISQDQPDQDGARPEIANSMVEEKRHEGMSTVLREDNPISSNDDTHDTMIDDDDNDDDDTHDPMDDTCLSTFSAVPNVDMTAFANLRGGSPFKTPRPLPDFPAGADSAKRGGTEPETPTTAKRSPGKNAPFDMSSPFIGSPTPRKRERDDQRSFDSPNLLDLTDQISLFPSRQRYSMQRQDRYSPSRRSPLRNPRESIRSPAKISLLDFDIPSAPTPRSIPTVTPRELESLKSSYLAEISSLKATLSGKEAEVSSLKKAVSDAERRVGEAFEEVRNEAARKETLEIEQAEWQRRGREMEEVLRSVKADILEGEQERERLQKRNEETEKGREQLESRVVELETQLAAARKSTTCEQGASDNVATTTKSAEETAREIQDAVEKVARDLHSLYKEKHETKVAALKKSYESRWEKRLRDVEKKLTAANEECERIKVERDTALQESARPDASMMARENEEHEAEKHVLEAQISGLQQEIATLKADSEQLRVELKAERAEKGDLVALVEEWLSMQNQPAAASQPKKSETTPEPVPQEQPSPAADSDREVARTSSGGLRIPSSSSSTGSAHGDRKIPRFGAPASRHGRGNSGGKSGIAVFTPGRSGIMGSIERMGRGGAA
ncbi:hypothetical protein BDV18DRAFT_145734 [Aspergillus unguis]